MTNLDPALAQGLATLLGAISTAILMYASHNWGPSKKAKKGEDAESDE